MRRDNLFWGIVILLLGGLFILKAAGIVTDVWGLFWPLVIILLGVLFMVGGLLPRFGGQPGEQFTIDLQGASEAHVEFNHGAGQMEISGGAAAGMLLEGTAAVGMSHSARLEGQRLEAKIDAGPSFIPFIGPGGAWQFKLANDVPMTLQLETGASQMQIDLRDVKVSFLKIETGASSVRLTVPATMPSAVVDIEGGAASFDIRVPEGVAARIHFEGGLNSVQVDRNRFPSTTGGFFKSADYDTAANRVDINIETGAGSIEVH